MRYIDPYELFSIADPGQVDEEALRKLRRRLLAEFELSKDGFLDWRGQSVDKTAAMDLLEAMADAQTRQNYWGMRQVSGLVDYLVGDDANLIHYFDWEEFQAQPGWHLFVSGFLAEKINLQLGKALEGEQWQPAVVLLGSIDQLAQETWEGAFKAATRKVHVAIIDLEHASDTTAAAFTFFDPAPFIHIAFIGMLNQFHDQFQHLRHAYAKALRELAILLADNRALPAALQLITAACELHQDLHQLKVCLDVKKQISQNLGNPANRIAPGSMKRDNIILIVAGILFVVFMVVNSIRVGRGYPSWLPEKEPEHRLELPPIPAKPATEGAASFYQALRSMPIPIMRDDIGKWNSSPHTGWSPYRQFGDTLWENKAVQMAEFSFRNDGDKDLVFFLERGEPLAIMSSYYVRAHSKLAFIAVPAGNYVVRIYDGKKWRDSIGRLEGKSLGAFTQDVEFVGDIVLTSEPSRHSAPELKVAIIGVPHYPTELTYDQYELSVKRQ